MVRIFRGNQKDGPRKEPSPVDMISFDKDHLPIRNPMNIPALEFIIWLYSRLYSSMTSGCAFRYVSAYHLDYIGKALCLLAFPYVKILNEHKKRCEIPIIIRCYLRMDDD